MTPSPGAGQRAGAPPPSTTPHPQRRNRSPALAASVAPMGCSSPSPPRPSETASDGDEANSPFTAALVRHFATAGVELRTALTLVQQDVYDRSRGKQLPYIECGLPELIFISGQGALPERDQLLIAMADLTPDIRAEVETLAATRNLPLAPLYAALLSADLEAQTPEERAALLAEAAQSYEEFQSELQKFQSDDPRVADLRAQAEEQLTLGAFDAARALLTDAAAIDATARTSIKETFVSRTLSEAATHMLNANAAKTDLRYDLAISDLQKATTLYAEVAADMDRDAQFSYTTALTSLGELHLVAGNTEAAWEAYNARAAFAQARVEADATDVEWVRELIWSMNDLGTVLAATGLPEGGRNRLFHRAGVFRLAGRPAPRRRRSQARPSGGGEQGGVASALPAAMLRVRWKPTSKPWVSPRRCWTWSRRTSPTAWTSRSPRNASAMPSLTLATRKAPGPPSRPRWKSPRRWPPNTPATR